MAAALCCSFPGLPPRAHHSDAALASFETVRFVAAIFAGSAEQLAFVATAETVEIVEADVVAVARQGIVVAAQASLAARQIVVAVFAREKCM